MNTEHVVIDHKGKPVFHCDTYEQAAFWRASLPVGENYTIELMDKPSEPKMTDAEVAGMFIDAARDLSKRRRLAPERSGIDTPERVGECLALWDSMKAKDDPEQADKVNNPSHYTQGGIECIDAMEAMLSRDEFIGYLRGNIFKYQWRYKDKNGLEDLKKANWYSAKLLELEESAVKSKP